MAPAGDRNARGHLPGTEPGGCRGGFWCLKGYFGVYRGILGCVGVFRGVQGYFGVYNPARSREPAGRDFRVDMNILVSKRIFWGV